MALRQAVSPPHRLGFLATLRQDRWWVEPALVAAGLAIFLGYLTVSAFLDNWAFEIGPYLSPVYEPKLHGPFKVWWFSPALLILWGPVGFRATCYYYRLAYYRPFFLSPPACAVAALPRKSSGETRFPSVLQNLHPSFPHAPLVFIPPRRIGAGRDRRPDRHRSLPTWSEGCRAGGPCTRPQGASQFYQSVPRRATMSPVSRAASSRPMTLLASWTSPRSTSASAWRRGSRTTWIRSSGAFWGRPWESPWARKRWTRSSVKPGET